MSFVTTRTNVDWVAALASHGEMRESAIQHLHAEFMRKLPFALQPWLTRDDPRFATFIEDVAQDAVMCVIKELHTFADRSLFTTWAHKIALNLAISELRRARWKDVSLNDLLDAQDASGASSLAASASAAPDLPVEQAAMFALVKRLLAEELTDKQRIVLTAIGLNGMPIQEVARLMNMEHNAVYKLMHDARVRLKKRLAREGMTTQDVLTVFAQHEPFR